jgi:hypothetical protein
MRSASIRRAETFINRDRVQFAGVGRKDGRRHALVADVAGLPDALSI